MKVFFLLLFILSLKNSSQSQEHKIQIPELKNITSDNWYPLPKDSLLIPDMASFDLVIVNWGSIDFIPLLRIIYTLAHKEDGWYCIIEKREHKFGKRRKDVRIDTTISRYKLDNIKGDSLFNTLIENHLFDIKDAVMNRTPCTRTDTILKKGKQKIVESIVVKTHLPTYKIEIRATDKLKSIYFFDPYYYEQNCLLINEIKWFVNCVNAFEKYLGK